MKTPLVALALLGLGLAAARAADPAAPAAPVSEFAVHEWGTFTSVQGADGVQMIWNPLVAPELPSFVYNRVNSRPARIRGITVAGKTGSAQRQRMETPVIYFYSDVLRSLDVKVNFPQGTLTEWYPQESAGDTREPGFRLVEGKDEPILHWSNVQVLPRSSCGLPLPRDASGSHYYAARETDSSELWVPENPGPTFPPAAPESKTPLGPLPASFEKFLFYRGLANFEAPLTVKLDLADSKHVILKNSGAEELSHLFVYEVSAGGGVWRQVENLKPGETRTVSLDPSAGVHSMSAADFQLDLAARVDSLRLNTSLVDALVGEGLYEREAAAMVKTWEDSWFGEPGLRVLYTLPRAWTDRTLPLTVTPAPKTVERVMIARAEIITPAMEQALLAKVEQYIAAPADERPRIVDETRALGLGRFAHPTRDRLFQTGSRSPEFATLSWQLVQAATVASRLPAPNGGK